VSIHDTSGQKTGGQATYPIHDEATDFPLSFTVVPRRGATTGAFVVRVEGMDGGDKVLISVQAQGTFIAGETRLINLWLAQLCAHVECEPDQTCHYEEGDRLAGRCGDILIPVSTDYRTGADEDQSLYPTLSVPVDETNYADADGGGGGEAEPPRAPNLPTVGSLRSVGTPRANGDKSLMLRDDGFEAAGRVCNRDGLCAVAGFVP
jgi:hypothetical protein